MNELRLAARDFVTDPSAQSDRVGEAASALSALLKKTRLELAPEQQDMIDGVAQRLAELPRWHRARHRADRAPRRTGRGLAAGARAVRIGDRRGARPGRRETTCSGRRTRSRRRCWRTIPHAAEQAAAAHAGAADRRSGAAIRGRRLRRCDHRDLARPKAEIADLDKEVLGTEGRQIGRVTDLLRDVSARRGRVLSNDFARTLRDDKWQSIMLGIAGVLIGLVAALFVVRRTVRPLEGDRRARSARSPAARSTPRSPPPTSTTRSATSRAPPKCSAARWSMPTRRARRPSTRLAEQRLAEESYRKLFEGSVDGIYVTTPAGALLNANPALARMMGYETPEELIGGISDIAHTIYVHPAARAEYQSLMQRDGMVREFEYQVRQRGGAILWLSDSATVVRDEAGEVVRYEGTVRDITDQKRAEDAIAEGRRLLQQVIDTVPAVINVKDKAAALRPDEPLHGRHFRDRAGGCDRPHHLRPDVALWRAKDRRKRQAGAGGRQGAWLLRRGIYGFRRQCAALAGQQAAAARCRWRDREHRHRRARHRRAQARRAGDAQGQGCRRSGVAQSARNPEFADRGGKARGAGPAGGGRRP